MHLIWQKYTNKFINISYKKILRMSYYLETMFEGGLYFGTHPQIFIRQANGKQLD